jgi:hypothetical protein
VSQEYPAAEELLVGPLILPSWARERPGKMSKRNGTTSIGENNKMRGDTYGRGKGGSEAKGGFKENMNRETRAAQTDLKMGIGGVMPVSQRRGVPK